MTFPATVDSGSAPKANNLKPYHMAKKLFRKFYLLKPPMEENAVGTKKIIFYEVKRVCTKIRDSNATHIHLAQVA